MTNILLNWIIFPLVFVSIFSLWIIFIAMAICGIGIYSIWRCCGVLSSLMLLWDMGATVAARSNTNNIMNQMNNVHSFIRADGRDSRRHWEQISFLQKPYKCMTKSMVTCCVLLTIMNHKVCMHFGVCAKVTNVALSTPIYSSKCCCLFLCVCSNNYCVTPPK